MLDNVFSNETGIICKNIQKKVVVTQPYRKLFVNFPHYTKILNAMRTEPTLTLADMKEITGISIAAIQKLLDQLIQKNMSSAVRKTSVSEVNHKFEEQRFLLLFLYFKNI